MHGQHICFAVCIYDKHMAKNPLPCALAKHTAKSFFLTLVYLLNNGMTIPVAKFVINCPYFTHGCDLVWQTMLAKRVFKILFINIIFYFSSVKSDILCEANTQNMLQDGTHLDFTQSRPYFMDNPEILGIFSIST